jgi:TRAP-type C4-dicarboxylate transport system permease small subunit
MANVLDWLERIVSYVNHKATWLAYVAITAMMAFVFTDVILRYFGHPTSGSNDVVQLLSVIAVSFAMGYTYVLKRHPTISLVVGRLPVIPRRVIRSIVAVLCLGLFVLLSKESFVLARHLWVNNEGTMTLGIPVAPLVYCVAIGSVLMCLVCTTDLLRSLFREAVK